MTQEEAARAISKVYAPRTRRFALVGIFLVALGLIGGLAALSGSIPGRGNHRAQAVIVLLFSPFALGLGALFLLSVSRGQPRLAMTERGLELEAWFGAQTADWSSLSEFRLTGERMGAANTLVKMARSEIVGPTTMRGFARKKAVIITDTFFTPLSEIADDLNRARARALGIAPPSSTPTAPPQKQSLIASLWPVFFVLILFWFAFL